MTKDAVVRSIIIPAIMPVLFFAVALSPVDVPGCRTRGLIAFALALVIGLAAIGSAGMALKVRMKAEAGSEQWIAATLVLAIPVVAMLVLA